MAYISLVTLGVQDVPLATQFYEALGWNKSTYSVDDVVSFLAGGTVVLALYGKDSLSNDANSAASASYAMNADSPELVNELIATAVAAGATVTAPAQRAEWGGYVGYFADADGHLWEVAHNPDFPLGDEGQVYLPGLEAKQEQQRNQIETQISDFVAGAEGDIEALATAVINTVRTAYDEIARQLAEQPNNTVIATMLALGQRGRDIPSTDPDHWVAHGASTLVSSLLGSAHQAGAEAGRTSVRERHPRGGLRTTADPHRNPEQHRRQQQRRQPVVAQPARHTRDNRAATRRAAAGVAG